MTLPLDRSRFKGPSGSPLLREVPLGTQVILKDRSLVEVIGNPGDGGWVQVRYLNSPSDVHAAGDEEFVFYTDVRDFAEGQLSSDGARVEPEAAPDGEARVISMQAVERLVLKDEVEQFLYHEAALLDERRYEEWVQLMADDIHYFMPIRSNVKFGEWDRENSDADSEISWFDEGKDMLEGRVRQLQTGVHWAEEPVSRIRHIISNIRVVRVEDPEIWVSDNFVVWHNRLLDEVNLFVGRRDHVLRRDPDVGFKVAKRTILLDQSTLLAKVVTFFF
jgi:3-phenylpropionate/cinnamic acid dioxygenase small subunit